MTDRNVANETRGDDDADDEDYRFDPADFDGDGDPVDSTPDRAPLVIGTCIVLGGLLFLAEPLVDARTVSGLEIRPVVPAAVVLAAGLLYGGGVYVRRGRRRLGYAHAGGALGWILVLLGTVFAHTVVLVVGVGVLLCGAAALAGLVWAAD